MADRDKLLLEYAKSFPLFCNLVWKYIGLPPLTPIQVSIAETLQNPPSDRMIIEGFRGVAKSFITCAYCVWNLWRDPQLKILIVSANKERADANATFIKKIINELPFLKHLHAREGQRDTQNLFDVGPAKPDHSPSVKSVGIKGQLTGSRADIIVSDDVEVLNNSFTQILRDQLFEAVKEYDAIIKPGPNSRIIYLGTPQNEMSLYNELQERGYACRIFPARYPYDAQQRASYGSRLAPVIATKYDSDPERYAGKPTDPQRFTEEDLQRREMSYRRAGFLLQFMLDTTLSDADKYPLRLRDFMVGDFDTEEAPMKLTWLPDPQRMIDDKSIPHMGLKGDFFYRYHTASDTTNKYAYKIMSIDPSSVGSDECAYSVLYYLNGYIYLMETGGYKRGTDDTTFQKLAKTAHRWKVNECVIEGNYGGGMWTKLFTPFLQKEYKECAVNETKSSGQKELRIVDTLDPILRAHKLITTPQCIAQDYASRTNDDIKYCLFYQLPRITQDRGALVHDDRLDALSIGVAYLLDFMGVDEDTGISELTEQWLEDSMESLYGFYTSKIGGFTYTDNTKEMYSTITKGIDISKTTPSYRLRNIR